MQSDQTTALLRVHGSGGVRVEAVTSALAAVDHAYNGVLAFLEVIDNAQRIRHEFPFPMRGWPLFYSFSVSGRGRRATRQFLPGLDVGSLDVSSLIASSDRLILQGVRLESPGFFDFLGKLNPLEVVRQYLNDGHERKKDEEYRNQAERDRLFLDNEIRRNQVIRERIDIARDLGATQRDLAPLVNVLVARPLERLNQPQDQNIITHAEDVKPRNDREV